MGRAFTDHFILIEGNYLKNVEEARSHSSDAQGHNGWKWRCWKISSDVTVYVRRGKIDDKII